MADDRRVNRMPPPGPLASRRAERARGRRGEPSAASVVDRRNAAADAAVWPRRNQSDGTSIARPSVILGAKPNVVDHADDEQWPSIADAGGGGGGGIIGRSRTESPMKVMAKPTDEGVGGGVQRTALQKRDKPPSDRHASRPTASETASKSASTPTTETKQMDAGMRLINEHMDWADGIVDFLSDNSDYVVIGAIGPQGTGKSTLLSMIGGNDAYDMYRQYIFRPASREAIETCKHQTCGIQIYVTKTRVILLDCQPMMSSSIIDEMIRNDKRYNYEYKTVENFVEVESLQLLIFMLQVCHTVLLCNDWYVDLNAARALLAAEMLKPTLAQIWPDPMQLVDRSPNIVFVHQRGKFDDFNLQTVKERCGTLAHIFRNSDLAVKGKLSMSLASSTSHFKMGMSGEAGDINYFVLSDMKLRGQKDEVVGDSKPSTIAQCSVPEYETLVREFRILIRALPRPPFTIPSVVFTEKSWYQYAAKTWDAIRKSHLVSEFGRTFV